MPKVKCDVSTCKYWAEGNKCTADKIFITSPEPDTAWQETHTFCDTFEYKED